MQENAKVSYTKWMLSGLPATLSTSPLSTFMPLYILSLGGSVVQVAAIVILYSLVSIISYFFWGRISDHIIGRKKVIVGSYAAITLLLCGLFFSTSFLYIAIAYALIGFCASAENNYLNILVLETDNEENWPKNFSRLQAVQNIGWIIGLVIGAVITGISLDRDFILVLAAASLVSMFTGIVYIKEERIVTVGRSLLGHINAAAASLIIYPFQAIKRSRLNSPGSAGSSGALSRILKSAGSYLGLFYISYFLFSAATADYNADYSAVLHIHGLSEPQVFTVILIAAIVQTVIFYYVGRIINKRRLLETAVSTLSIRAVTYVLVGLSFLTIGSAFFYSNIVLFAFSGGLIYPIYYTASYSQFFNTIKGKGKGNAIGMYGGFGSIGTLLGTTTAGILAASGHFSSIYFTGAIMLGISLYALYMVSKLKAGPQPENVAKLTEKTP